MTQSLRLVQGQELEESAFVVFQVDLELLWVRLLSTLQRLDASVVLPYETLELGRSISKLGGGLRQDLVGVRLVHVVSHCLTPLVSLIPLNETA